MTWTRPLLGAAVTAAIALTAACSSAPASSSAPAVRDGGTLTFQLATAPVDVDATTTQDNNGGMQLMAAWFQSLAAAQPDGTYRPVLATSWTTAPGGLSWTFRIRPHVRFSDGRPLTAADVAYSLNRNIAPAVSLLNFLTGYVKSITAAGPLTVQITMKKPWPNLLAELSSPDGAIYPAGSLTTPAAEKTFFTQHPVGTGPFTLTQVTPGVSWTVTRNPGYWGPRAHLDRIVFTVDTADTTRAAAVLGGQADIAISPPAAQVATLERDPSVRVSKVTSSLVEIICLNVTRGPLASQDVRQAISLAINRPAIVTAGLAGYGTPASTYFVGPATQTFQYTGGNLYPYNLTRARQLMTAAGIKTPVTIPFEVSTGTAQDAILTVVQAGLAQIGIKVIPQRADQATVDNSIIAQHYTMAETFWGDVNADPTTQPLFADVPAFCCNAYFTGLRDPQLIAMTWQAAATSARAAEQQQYDQIQQREAADAYVLPLYFPQLIHVYSSAVTGFNVDPYGMYDWAQMGLAS